MLTSCSTGACILYGIARVVIGENKTFLGGESYLKQRGIEVVNMESKECQDLMDRFIEEKPQIWCVNIPSHTVRLAAKLA
jgi:creatinine deaminase